MRTFNNREGEGERGAETMRRVGRKERERGRDSYKDREKNKGRTQDNAINTTKIKKKIQIKERIYGGFLLIGKEREYERGRSVERGGHTN